LLIFSAIFDHSFPQKEKRRAQVLLEHGAKESNGTRFLSPVKKKKINKRLRRGMESIS